MIRKLVTGNNKLAREITLTLIIKVMLIYGIWYFFFSEPVDDSLTDDKVRSQILGMTIVVPKVVVPKLVPNETQQTEIWLAKYFQTAHRINAASEEEKMNGC